MAMNKDRQAKYFDYDYKSALEFAGVTSENDPRVYRNKRNVAWADSPTDNPSNNQMVLWIKD